MERSDRILDGSHLQGPHAGSARTPAFVCCSGALASVMISPCSLDVAGLVLLQVVGEEHDVEEGAPVLKKTVFGEPTLHCCRNMPSPVSAG
jgi:hypothetical protein